MQFFEITEIIEGNNAKRLHSKYQQDLKNEREKRIYMDDELNQNEVEVAPTKQENEDGEHVGTKEEEKLHEDRHKQEKKELNEGAEFMQNEEKPVFNRFHQSFPSCFPRLKRNPGGRGKENKTSTRYVL